MQTIPPDIEDELRKWLPGALVAAGEPTAAAYAGSMPAELSGRSVTFVATGGPQINVAMYRMTVSVDCRAARESEAVRLGRITAGLLDELGRTQSAGSMTVTRVTVMSLPYINPDQRHPSLHRVTVSAELIVKAELVG